MRQLPRLAPLVPVFILTLGLYAYWNQATKEPAEAMTEVAPASGTAVSTAGSSVASSGIAEPLSNVPTEELEKLALNVSEQGDTRAEAIEKLSRAPDDHILETLTQIAARSLPKSGGGLFVAQERVFAAMAIEGILNHPSKEQQRKSIEAILKTQSDQFIVTRANMALGFIKGLTPHPKEIDEKNLSNLFN